MFELSGGWRKTLCPYCGVGCGLLVQIEDGTVKKVKGDPEHPSSLGDVCAKAVHLPPALRTPDRLLYPQVRTRRDAELSRVPWELAVRTVADRLREIVATPTIKADGLVLAGHNPLIGVYPGADGVKTGTTDAAGKAIVGSASHNGHRVFVVVMHSDDLLADSTALFDWVWQSFSW